MRFKFVCKNENGSTDLNETHVDCVEHTHVCEQKMYSVQFPFLMTKIGILFIIRSQVTLPENFTVLSFICNNTSNNMLQNHEQPSYRRLG
jgi:hypothetical protein